MTQGYQPRNGAHVPNPAAPPRQPAAPTPAPPALAHELVEAVSAEAPRYFAFARAGETVFLECSVEWTVEQYRQIAEQIDKSLAGSGVNAVLLPAGIRVARVEVASE